MDEGGLKDSGVFAPDLIISTVNQHVGYVNPATGRKGLTILCLGPLTNLALATIKDPELPSKVAQVFFIGGSFGFNASGTARATGDNPVSEWNVYVDPEAASLVFNAGYNLTALGLDVVTRPDIELSKIQRDVLQIAAEEGSPSAKFVIGVVEFARKRDFKSWCCLIDSLAVAAAINGTVVKTEEIEVVVETISELSLGQTIVERRERVEHRWKGLPTIKAAADVDATKFLNMLVDTIVSRNPARVPA